MAICGCKFYPSLKKTFETFLNLSFNLLNVWQKLPKSLIQFHSVDKIGTYDSILYFLPGNFH